MVNIIDYIIEQVSPNTALKRAENRRKIKAMERKYDGAKRPAGSNLNTSTNIDIANALPLLRARSKDLEKNNPYVKSAIRKIGNNTVGCGVLPTPLHKDKIINEALKQAWKCWAEETDCDFYGKQNFYAIQKLVTKTVAKSGDCFIRFIQRQFKVGQIPLQLMVFDAELIDQHKTSFSFHGLDNYIRNGIEYDKYGRVVAYWVFPRNPNEFAVLESERIKASEIIHVYEIDNPAQERGVPRVTPAMVRAKDFDDYEFSELTRQKYASCFTAFVTETDDSGSSGRDDDFDLDTIEPGRIETLPPGKQVTFGTPPDAGNFSDYSKTVLRGIAAGIGVTYEAMTGDLSNVNFSSYRAGHIEFKLDVEDLQWLVLIPMFCDKVWKRFVMLASLMDIVPIDTICKAQWTPPRREMLNPVEETKAMVEAIRGGLMSWQEIVRQQGYIPDELIKELQKDKELFDSIGIKPYCDPRYDSNRPPIPNSTAL